MRTYATNNATYRSAASGGPRCCGPNVGGHCGENTRASYRGHFFVCDILLKVLSVDFIHDGDSEQLLDELSRFADCVAEPGHGAPAFQVNLSGKGMVKTLTKLCEAAELSISSLQTADGPSAKAVDDVCRRWSLFQTLKAALQDNADVARIFEVSLPQALEQCAQQSFVIPLQRCRRSLRQRPDGAAAALGAVIEVQRKQFVRLRHFEAFAARFPDVQRVQEAFQAAAESCDEGFTELLLDGIQAVMSNVDAQINGAPLTQQTWKDAGAAGTALTVSPLGRFLSTPVQVIGAMTGMVHTAAHQLLEWLCHGSWTVQLATFQKARTLADTLRLQLAEKTFRNLVGSVEECASRCREKVLNGVPPVAELLRELELPCVAKAAADIQGGTTLQAFQHTVNLLCDRLNDNASADTARAGDQLRLVQAAADDLAAIKKAWDRARRDSGTAVATVNGVACFDVQTAAKVLIDSCNSVRRAVQDRELVDELQREASRWETMAQATQSLQQLTHIASENAVVQDTIRQVKRNFVQRLRLQLQQHVEAQDITQATRGAVELVEAARVKWSPAITDAVRVQYRKQMELLHAQALKALGSILDFTAFTTTET